MQLLEHQAKQLLGRAGLSVPTGQVFTSAIDSAAPAFPAVAKSQVPVGGRGKLGGVRLVHNQAELQSTVREILSLKIKGHRPESVLVEQAVDITRELYLSLRINRDQRRIEYLTSPDGGIEIESAGSTIIIPHNNTNRIDTIATVLKLDLREVESLLADLERCFFDNDLLLLEINPLVVTAGSVLVCADAKILVDDNARFRQPHLPWHDETLLRPLGGTIGVIANGAGMAMSTMDTIYAAGGEPANFLDIGGGTGEDIFVTYLRQITELPGVTSIIINIFAGITRCDDIARGIIAASQQIPGLVPLFIRLEGTRQEEASDLLRATGIAIQPDLQTCVAKALEVRV